MKIVIVYASSGAGHERAAQAVWKVLKTYPGLTLHLIDSLDYAAPLFRFFYPRIYLFLVHFFPAVWGFFYQGLNRRWIAPLLKGGRRVFNALNGKRLEAFLLREKPDCVVSTHFFASEVVSAMKKKGRLKARLLTVVTDFVVHAIWISSSTDAYLVGSVDAKKTLMDRGVPKERIAVLGIPVDPQFEEAWDRMLLSQKLGISPETFTVLVASGGFGIGPIEKLVLCLLHQPWLQMLVVCGRNRSLYKRLVQKTGGLHHRVKLFEFVDNVHELMAVSDCMVSKSGGLMMSEALTRRLPTFILHPIPGQESGNRDVLVRHRAAIAVHTIRDLAVRFEDRERLKEALAEVTDGIDAFHPRHTAQRVARFVVGEEG